MISYQVAAMVGHRGDFATGQEGYQRAEEAKSYFAEAEKKAREAEERKKALEGQLERLPKDSFIKRKELAQQIQSADAQKKAAESSQQEWLKQFEDIKKDARVQEYLKTNRLVLEPPRPTPQPMGLFDRLKKNVTIIFNEGRAFFSEKLGGSSETIIQIRSDLDKIYNEFGDEKLLQKARNNAQLSKQLTDVQERLETHKKALDQYRTAIEKKTVDREALKKEISLLAADLLQAAGQAEQAAEQAERAGQSGQADREISDRITQEVLDTLYTFGIPYPDVVRLAQEAGIKIELRAKYTKNLTDAINASYKLMNDIIGQYYAKALNEPRVVEFNKNLNTLERTDVSTLPSEDQQTVKLTVADANKVLSDAFWNTLVKGPLSPDDQVVVLNKILEHTSRFLDADKEFVDRFGTYVQEEGVTPSQPISAPLFKLTDPIKKSLKSKVDAVIDNLSNPQKIADSYKELSTSINNLKSSIAKSAVNQDSLQAQAWILKEAYGPIFDALQKQSKEKDIGSQQLGSIMIDIMGAMDDVAKKLAIAAGSLIQQKETGQLQAAKMAPPPPPAIVPMPPLPKAPATPQGNLFDSIKKRPTLTPVSARVIPKKESKQENDLVNTLASAMAARRTVIKEEPEEPESSEEGWPD